MDTLCEKCLKPEPLCLCEGLKSAISNSVKVVILQYPQEAPKLLSTVPFLTLGLKNVVVKTGLSWGNLKKIIGQDVDPKSWAVAYLGSVKFNSKLADALYFISKKNQVIGPVQAGTLKGLIVLDGTWSQAKTLWWRNSWLLKCHRVALKHDKKSLYGKLRKEPRPEALSTLESTLLALKWMESNSFNSDSILLSFERFLEKAQNLNPKVGAKTKTR